MSVYYDGNLGFWDTNEEGPEFYHKIQARDVRKNCAHCGKEVYLQPRHNVCDTCADMRDKEYYQ